MIDGSYVTIIQECIHAAIDTLKSSSDFLCHILYDEASVSTLIDSTLHHLPSPRFVQVHFDLDWFYFPSAVVDGEAATGAIRLLLNGIPYSDIELGVVQVYINGSWGNICINMFGDNEANVICHQMGRHSYIEYSTSEDMG